MTQPIDVQSAIIAALLERLASVPDFGAKVVEDEVRRILDAEDDLGLPEDLIVVQPGQTEESENPGFGSCTEKVTVNIVLMTRRRKSPPLLRAGRFGVKVALSEYRRWLGVKGVTGFDWQADTPLPAGDGHRWSCRAMPLQITYNQHFK